MTITATVIADSIAEGCPRLRVKPLVWEYHPAGTMSAPPAGHSYIIETRMKGRLFFIKGILPSPQFDTLEAAKSAAQADHERRILAALEGSHD